MSVFVFSSPDCNPCKVLKPTIQDLKEEFPGLQWMDVNIRNDPQGLTQKYGVRVVPTVVVVSNHGVDSHTGTNVAGYYRILQNATR
jgi:thioredoxin-like negative regulator of GroEL